MLVVQTRQLELYQWFVRSHLADWAGGMANAGAASDLDAARSVANNGGKPRNSTSNPKYLEKCASDPQSFDRTMR
jgi:hypothetical protein